MGASAGRIDWRLIYGHKNLKKAIIILVVYLIATLALLLLGYSVQKPKVAWQEFPFTITYFYQGKTETISNVYVGEYVRSAKYLGEDSVGWYGYMKDHAAAVLLCHGQDLTVEVLDQQRHHIVQIQGGTMELNTDDGIFRVSLLLPEDKEPSQN